MNASDRGPSDAAPSEAQGGPGPSAARTVVHAGAVAPAVRAAGRSLVAGALAVAVALVLRLTGAGWTRPAAAVLLVVAAVAVLGAAGRAVAVAFGRGPRLELGPTGFVNRTRPPLTGRGELRRGSWVDVRTVQAVRAGGRRLLVLTTVDQRRSVVLLRRLAADPAAVEADIQDRLDAANGYRPYGVLTAPPGAPRP